jgi:hypothetical protein
LRIEVSRAEYQPDVMGDIRPLLSIYFAVKTFISRQTPWLLSPRFSHQANATIAIGI